MNTPSGTNITALDKFMMHYMDQGYDWKIYGNDIIFTRYDKKLFAKATYNENGWINGYNVSEIK